MNSITSLWDWHSVYPAPAKLNLFLHVVGRRADGYHLLQTLFRLVDHGDALRFSLRADGDVRLITPLPGVAPESDLTVRAARLLQRETGCRQGVEIAVDKRLPLGGGLGGGSSDAATVLLALNHLWQLGLPRSRLQQIGLTLGADVPFFVGGRPAFVGGIGEQLHPLPDGTLSSQVFAVVKPAPAITTAAIFGSPLLVRDTEPVIVMSFLADTQLSVKLGSGYGRNDLQPPAEAHCPEVTQVARWLETRFGNSRMSGSGSAVFARLGTATSPMATVWPDLPAGWVGRMCRSLDQHPLADWAS